MRRLSIASLCVVALLAASAAPLSADVRSDQRVKFQLGGAIGKLINMFGGKGAREGVTSMVAVKGDRKVTMSDTTGQIIDLSEEKIYDLDMRKKTYKVTTFAELRRQMEQARRDAEKSAAEERSSSEPSKPAEKDPNQKEFEVDFDVKNTNETRTINGFNTTKSVITITVREKGKTLNDAGGMVMTNDLWLTKSAPSTKELTDFDMRYAEKLYGPMVVGASAQDMAMAMAMYPQIKPAMDKLRAEGSKIEGTPILTEIRMEAVPPGTANQTAEALPAPEPEQKKRGLGGMLGGLKKMAENAGKSDNNSKPARSIFLTTSVEMLKLTTDVDAAAVALPAGFKEDK
ncbi:MAG TPA: hypothetical protein VEC39_14450 [Vicinamibacterales bacterium]|nr:hypothetical protein [Vicinamibacterales bacterium]